MNDFQKVLTESLDAWLQKSPETIANICNNAGINPDDTPTEQLVTLMIAMQQSVLPVMLYTVLSDLHDQGYFVKQKP